MDFGKAVAVGIVGAVGGRALYLLTSGRPITFESMLFIDTPGPRVYGTSSFAPYAPGAKRVGPLAPVLPFKPSPGLNIATNQGSDVQISPGDED